MEFVQQQITAVVLKDGKVQIVQRVVTDIGELNAENARNVLTEERAVLLRELVFVQ